MLTCAQNRLRITFHRHFGLAHAAASADIASLLIVEIRHQVVEEIPPALQAMPLLHTSLEFCKSEIVL